MALQGLLSFEDARTSLTVELCCFFIVHFVYVAVAVALGGKVFVTLETSKWLFKFGFENLSVKKRAIRAVNSLKCVSFA